MAKQVVIDGEVYTRTADLGPIKIVVLDRGFVYVGRVAEDPAGVVIHGARCLVRWGTTNHLGELVNGPLAKTKLGAACVVRARTEQIIHTIEVSQDGWSTHIT
jgi:hypothetical protein